MALGDKSLRAMMRKAVLWLFAVGQYVMPAYLLLVLLLPVLSPLVGGYAEENVIGLASPRAALYVREWWNESITLRGEVASWVVDTDGEATFIPAWFYAVGYLGDKPQFYNITVRIGRGNGTLSIEGEVDRLFVLSARVAVLLSSLLAGVDPWSLDLEIVVDPLWGSRSMVGGPSASLPMAIVLMNLLGYDVNMTGKVYTGAVSLDGLTVPVGGVDIKYAGVRDRGLGLFFYSRGSEYKFLEHCDMKVLGPYVFRGCSRDFLPVVEVNGTPISSIYEVLGINEPMDAWDLLKRVEAGSGACRVLRDFYSAVEKNVLAIVARARNALSLYAAREVYLERAVSDLSLSLRYLIAARDAIERGYCLLAADYYGYALRHAIRGLSGLVASDNGIVLEVRRLAVTYRTLYLDFFYKVVNGDSIGAQRLLAYALASLYAAEASEAYRRAEKIHDLTILVGNAPSLLRVALMYYASSVSNYVRAISLLYIAERAKDDTIITNGVVISVSRKLVEMASVMAHYSYLISSNTRVQSPLVSSAVIYANKASSAWKNGNYILSIGFAVKSLSLSLLYMALFPGIEEFYKERLNWIIYSTVVIGNPYCLPCRLYVEKLLYNRGADPASLLRDAESLYSWSLANRLLELEVFGG